MPELYEKITNGKRTTYKPYVPPQINMPEIEQSQIVTLLSALTMSMLMSVQNQLPEHAKLARTIKGVVDAVRALAKLNAEPLQAELVDVGVSAWNAAIQDMQIKLGGGNGK